MFLGAFVPLIGAILVVVNLIVPIRFTAPAEEAGLDLAQHVALGDVITRAMLDVRELPERYVEERHIHRDIP